MKNEMLFILPYICQTTVSLHVWYTQTSQLFDVYYIYCSFRCDFLKLTQPEKIVSLYMLKNTRVDILHEHLR